MTLAKVRDWLEIVGLFSVVLSLIFVGLQMKQSQDIATAAQYQARADHNLELGVLAYENDFHMRRQAGQSREWYQNLIRTRGPDPSLSDEMLEWSDEELARHASLCRLRFKQFENIHYQWHRGLIDDENWEAFRATLRNNVRGRECGALFDYYSELDSFPARFRSLIIELKRKSDDA